MVVEVVVVLVEAEHACEVAQLSVCDLRATMSSPFISPGSQVLGTLLLWFEPKKKKASLSDSCVHT